MKKELPYKSFQKSKQTKSQLKLTSYILLFAYLLIPVFTPNFYTLDSNGPKFLAIAILNLISLFVFFTNTDFKQHTGIRSGFFRNFIGLAYTLFLVFSLLSFFQAINLSESVLNFVKIFTVFSSTYVLYVIFSSNRGYVLHAAIAVALLLLFDSFMVYYNIIEYVNKNLTSIADIKSIYSNKNILSAALFIKIPAAMWLMLFTEGWKKKLGYLAFLSGVIAVLFMSSRAFYMGLALLVIALALFFILQHFAKKKNLSVKKVLLFAGFVVIALTVYSLTQKFLYPKVEDTFNTGVVERLATIRADEWSANSRLTTWKRSFRLIREKPLLGVGTGNWKINVLKYESPAAGNYIINFKNHNDFIEVTAETGLSGGLTYLSIFILILVIFIKKALNREADEEMVKYLFLPAFGILAYSVDAFFNFPMDRPEIQSLFAIYVAMAIAFSGTSFSYRARSVFKQPLMQKKSRNFSVKFAFATSFLLLSASILILSMNMKSIHLQRYVIEDEKSNKYSHSSSFFIEGFPIIPNLSLDGAPIKTYIARYLINENRSDEAVSLLINDNPSPYDSRREYYLSIAYDKMGITDSAIVWGQRASALKPPSGNMASLMSSRLFIAGRQQEAVHMMDSLLACVKTIPEAWIQAADQNVKMGNYAKALLILESAVKYLPDNEEIVKNWRSLHNLVSIMPFEELYHQATQALSAKRYSETLKLLNDFISKKPGYTEAYQNRAYCLCFLGEYSKSLLDIEIALNKGDGNEAFLINIRGANYIGLGRTVEACLDFKMAMDKGSAEGATNYRKFCDQKVKK